MEWNEDDIEVMNTNSTLKTINKILKKITTIQFFIVLLSFILFLIDIELYWQRKDELSENGFLMEDLQENEGQQLSNIFRSIISTSCLILIVLAVFYHRYQSIINRIRKFYPFGSSMCNRFELPKLTQEIVIFSIHLPPFIQPSTIGTSKFEILQGITAILVVSKFFLLIRLLAFHSPINKSNGRFIVAMRGMDYSNSFLVKVWLTLNPVKGLFVGVLIFLTLNSHLLLLVEKGEFNSQFDCYEEGKYRKIKSFKDAWWVLVITFLTVGYGDYFPVTYGGRFIAILTTIGGQLYAAIIIGMVHSHMMLTSEEQGVLSIIRNNKKEATKKNLAAQIVQELFKMFLFKMRQLNKHNIHWYKMKQVSDHKFNLYILVLKFKKIKSDLNDYYQSREADQNLNIIRNTETQLTLLASQVITIFDYIKNPQLERLKNVNQVYKKSQTIMNKIIEEEQNFKQNLLTPNRLSTVVEDKIQMKQTIFNFGGGMTQRLGTVTVEPSSESLKRKKSMHYAKTFVEQLQMKRVSKGLTNVVQPYHPQNTLNDSQYLNVPHSGNKKLSGFYSNFSGDELNDSLVNKMKQVQEQEKIQQKLASYNSPRTPMHHPTSSRSRSSSQVAMSQFRNIMNQDSLQEQVSSNSSEQKVSITKSEDVANQIEKMHTERQSSPPPHKAQEETSLEEDVKKTHHKRDRRKSSYIGHESQSPTFIKSKNRLRKNKTIRSPRKGKIQRQSSSSTASKKSRRASFSKSNTMRGDKRGPQKRVSLGNVAKSSLRLKTIKTQLEPTMNSIIEEEEYYTEEEEENDDDEQDESSSSSDFNGVIQEGSNEERSSSSSSEEEQFESTEEQKQDKSKKMIYDQDSDSIPEHSYIVPSQGEDYEVEEEDQRLKTRKLIANNQQNFNLRNTPLLGAAFTEFKIKELAYRQFEELGKRIHQNQTINKKAATCPRPIQKLKKQSDEFEFPQSSNRLDAFEFQKSSSSLSKRECYRKTLRDRQNNSFLVSEEAVSSKSKLENEMSEEGELQSFVQASRKSHKNEKNFLKYLKQDSYLTTNTQNANSNSSAEFLTPSYNHCKTQKEITQSKFQNKVRRPSNQEIVSSQNQSSSKIIQVKVPEFDKYASFGQKIIQIDLLDGLDRCYSLSNLSPEQKQAIFVFQTKINEILTSQQTPEFDPSDIQSLEPQQLQKFESHFSTDSNQFKKQHSFDTDSEWIKNTKNFASEILKQKSFPRDEISQQKTLQDLIDFQSMMIDQEKKIQKMMDGLDQRMDRVGGQIKDLRMKKRLTDETPPKVQMNTYSQHFYNNKTINKYNCCQKRGNKKGKGHFVYQFTIQRTE